MNKEFIPYEEALALKELGFDEPCFVYYKASNENKPAYPNHGITRNSLCMNGITAPLKSQAFRWFREKYPELDFGVGKIYNGTNNYHYHINLQWEFFEGTYEEAELACLRKLIEIVTEYGKRIYFS